MWRRFGHDCARTHGRAGTGGRVDRHLFGVRPGGSGDHDDFERRYPHYDDRSRTGNRIDHGRDTHDDGAADHDQYARRINLHHRRNTRRINLHHRRRDIWPSPRR